MGGAVRRREARIPEGREVMHIPGVLELALRTASTSTRRRGPRCRRPISRWCGWPAAYTLMEMLGALRCRATPRRWRASSRQGAQLTVSVAGDPASVARRAGGRCSTKRRRRASSSRRVLENWRAFRAEQHRWFSIADARTEMAVYALTAAQSCPARDAAPLSGTSQIGGTAPKTVR